MSDKYHLQPAVVDLYRKGRLSFEREPSVEAYLLACPTSGEMLRSTVAAERLETIWEQGDGGSMNPPPNFVERFVTRCGLPEATVRVVARHRRCSWRGRPRRCT